MNVNLIYFIVLCIATILSIYITIQAYDTVPYVPVNTWTVPMLLAILFDAWIELTRNALSA